MPGLAATAVLAPKPVSEAGIATFECVLRAWQAHEKELLAFLRHRTGESDAAQDILQYVFLKSLRQGKDFCALDNPRAWLFQVARNALIDSVRLAKPVVELSDQVIATSGDTRAPVDELDACLARNLQELDDADRDIIQACDLDRQTVRAYAKANELSLAAAKSRLLRARKRLRDSLVHNCQIRFDETGNVCCHVPRDPP